MSVNTTLKTPLIKAISDCWVLLLGMGVVMLGFGLQVPLLGLRATMEGFSPVTTGLIMSCYFVGFITGSIITPIIVSKVGHVRVFAALASIVSAVALLHVVYLSPMAWMFMRFLTGTCFAGIYIVAESWLNDIINNGTRGRLLSIYMVVTLGGMGSGPLLLNTADPNSFELFIVVSVFFSMALVPILLTVGRIPAFKIPRKVKIADLNKEVPIGIAACFITGVSNGTIFGIGAVYAENIGLSLSEISLFMTSAIWGGLLFQWPIGLISDKLDRRFVLTAVTFLASIITVSTLIIRPGIIFGHLIMVFLLGGMSFPMYSLTLALINDRLQPDQMVAASSTLILVYGSGAFFGPVVAGAAITLWGGWGFLFYLSIIHALLFFFALFRMRSTPTVPMEEQGPSVYIARTSAIAAAAAFEDENQPTL
jgi:MFS family permease